MLVVGIDASTTAVGWSIFDWPDYYASGVFVPGSEAWEIRIAQVHTWLVDFIAELKYQFPGPIVIGYEVASGSHGNMHTNRLLGAVHWACWWAVQAEHLEWREVNVQRVKATDCHKDSLSVARTISGKGEISGDEADAIGVALAVMRWEDVSDPR